MIYKMNGIGASRSRRRSAFCAHPDQLELDFEAARRPDPQPSFTLLTLEPAHRRRLAERGLRGPIATVIAEQLFNLGDGA